MSDIAVFRQLLGAGSFARLDCGFVDSCSSSDRPALFVEREYNAFGGFAKAARESAATRATNTERVSSIHLDTQMTCSFAAEVVNGCQRPVIFLQVLHALASPWASPPKARWQRSSLQE